MTTQQDLFGEPHIQIKDNPTLERVANHILALKLRLGDDYLLQGNSMGELDSRIITEFWMDEGLSDFISPTRKEDFIQFLNKTTNSELITRARRYLVEHGDLRPKATVIVKAERDRARIAKAMR